MSEAIDTQSLHHLVDRLSPAQARHLRLIISQDRELAPVARELDQKAEPESGVPADLLSLVGRISSGRTNGAENTDHYIRERLARRRTRRA
ncbi:hypothetical protein L1785_13810 [Antribacter sp. KLBMP9083]|uniref:Uncharacterized protein n=1 Tax=Antribacter soli TaxID=2910976 RepID=A0AA41UCG6_9MICO|nr:hypothetical protein [Antribacter soli]MCF4122054.1 hypothetical protein [Antribacter soli]